MNKKINTVLAIAVIILIAGAMWMIWFNSNKQNQNSELLDYYKTLAKECESKQSYSCCMSSVNNMADGSYLLAPGDTLVESGCPEGYEPNMLKCSDSFKWCEPAQNKIKVPSVEQPVEKINNLENSQLNKESLIESCQRTGGIWKEESDPCEPTCDYQRKKMKGEELGCITVTVPNCECEKDKCWNGSSCEPL